MQHKLNTYLSELEVTVIAHLSPSVPPVPCSDPDHPAYSDPGDPGEKYVEAVLLRSPSGKTLDITEYLPNDMLEALAQEAYDEVVKE
jgi:hypothetical protein